MIVHPDTLQVLITQPDSLHLALSVAQADTLRAVLVSRGFWESFLSYFPTAVIAVFSWLSWMVYRRMADIANQQKEILENQTQLQDRVFHAQYVRKVVVTLAEQYDMVWGSVMNYGKTDTILEVVIMTLTPPSVLYKYDFQKFQNLTLEYGDDVPIVVPRKVLISNGFVSDQRVLCHVLMRSGEMYSSKPMKLKLEEYPETSEEPPAEFQTPPGV